MKCINGSIMNKLELNASVKSPCAVTVSNFFSANVPHSHLNCGFVTLVFFGQISCDSLFL